MADKGDKVKKGFGFYLMMLILILVAAFLIIVMVMMFSDGKVILGYKYFTSGTEDKNVTYTQTTDATPIDFHFATTDRIYISAGYADVQIVAADENSDDSKDSITVKNEAKGFAKKAHQTKLSFSARESVVEDETGEHTVLNVVVKEPKGFLYFSKDVKITIAFRRETIENMQCELNISTTSGDVSFKDSVGKLTFKNGSKLDVKDYATLSDNVNVTTKSGNISFGGVEDGEKLTFKSLYLTSGSGKIRMPYSLLVTDEVKIVNNSGNVTLDKGINAVNEANFDIEKGSLTLKGLAEGEVKLITTSARINIEHIKGSFDTNKALNMRKAKINITKVEGDVSIPLGNSATVKIDEIDGNAYINTTSGQINIGRLTKTCEIETQKGKINVTFDDSQNAQPNVLHNITSKSGAVNVDMKGKIFSQTTVRTNGKIKMTIDEATQFNLYIHDGAGKPIEQLSSKMHIDFIRDDYSYGMAVNDNTNSLVKIIFYSNNNITMSLRKLENA